MSKKLNKLSKKELVSLVKEKDKEISTLEHNVKMCELCLETTVSIVGEEMSDLRNELHENQTVIKYLESKLEL
jgi:predicted RNase H-like nuclease (RuvC/YqgF family)